MTKRKKKRHAHVHTHPHTPHSMHTNWFSPNLSLSASHTGLRTLRMVPPSPTLVVLPRGSLLVGDEEQRLLGLRG